MERQQREKAQGLFKSEVQGSWKFYCSPFWYQLLGNISAVLEAEDTQPRKHTLGSLFDGIGGFPLCWAMHNGAETVRWNSEIEEFPEAVVTRHFGDEDLGIEGDISKYINVGERANG